MNKLIKLQNDFVEGIYNSKKRAILKNIKKTAVKPEELFDIYRNNVFCTLNESLQITYELTAKKIGEKNFKKIAYDFIKKNRSQSGNLDDYGESFPQFLKKSKIKNALFLSQLAQMEWLMHLSYLAKNTKGIALDKLKVLDEEKLFKVKFNLHPSCYLIKSSYNLVGFLKNKKIVKKQIYILISRTSDEVISQIISKEEFNFLNATQNKKTLYQIYAKHKINIQNCLQKFISNRVLDNFYF